MSSKREYVIERAVDGASVVLASVNWIFVDRRTNRPLRIPDEFRLAVEGTGAVQNIEVRWNNPVKTADAHRYIHLRRVQTNDLDTAKHVNHAAYVRWIEQAYFDAMRSAGHPIEKTRGGDWSIVQGAHEIEYFEPAFDNEEIRVVSWVHELGRVRGAWIHEIFSDSRRLLLTRDYSVGIFINRAGKPISAPVEVIQDVIRGPPG